MSLPVCLIEKLPIDVKRRICAFIYMSDCKAISTDHNGTVIIDLRKLDDELKKHILNMINMYKHNRIQ